MGGRWNCYIPIEYNNKRKCWIEPDGQKHPNVRYYVDVFTNANDSPKTSLSKNAHGLPIDLTKPTCGVQQTNFLKSTMQDASSLVNL